MGSTIPAAKQAFLNSQTTLLAQPLAPSRAWTAANDASDDPLPERAVSDALFHLNHKIQQHCRRVYAPQATRNISEQINHVYTRDAERRMGGEEDVEGGIGRELDLTNDATVSELPLTWPSEKDVDAYPMESKRYADAVQQLASLNEQRRQLRERVERLGRLKSMTEPLKTGDGGAGVQENIITRNGAVEKELERMRFLLARVGGRVHALPKDTSVDVLPKEIQDTDGPKVARKRRVDEFLADKSVFPS